MDNLSRDIKATQEGLGGGLSEVREVSDQRAATLRAQAATQAAALCAQAATPRAQVREVSDQRARLMERACSHLSDECGALRDGILLGELRTREQVEVVGAAL